MISTTCHDECPGGSSVSGPRGPGGGDGGTALGFAFLTGFGGPFFAPDFLLERSELDMGLGFDGATLLRASPVLAQPEHGRSGWSFLGTAAPLTATSSRAMDLHCRERTQLTAAISRRRGTDARGFSGITRPETHARGLTAGGWYKELSRNARHVRMIWCRAVTARVV
jgi:hypothetical protein